MVVQQIKLIVGGKREVKRYFLLKLNKHKLVVEDEAGFLQEVHLEVRIMLLVLQVMNQICHAFEDGQIQYLIIAVFLQVVHEVADYIANEDVLAKQLGQLIFGVHAVTCCLQLLQVVLCQDFAHCTHVEFSESYVFVLFQSIFEELLASQAEI